MTGNPNSLFGKQMHKARLARHWSQADLAARTRITEPYISRIENGHRPPTKRVALAMDKAFETSAFTELYTEMLTWLPPGFRDWPEIENKSGTLRVWSPGVMDGLVQVPPYAGALLRTLPGATGDAINGRLRQRMDRQKKVLSLESGPATVHVIVDELALFRRVGGADVMDAQLAHLYEVATESRVIVQVLPAVHHPATASAFSLADGGVFVEHVLGGAVYSDASAVTIVASLFDWLRTECYGRSESALIIRRARRLWIREATGESRASAGRRGHSASRRPATPE